MGFSQERKPDPLTLVLKIKEEDGNLYCLEI